MSHAGLLSWFQFQQGPSSRVSTGRAAFGYLLAEPNVGRSREFEPGRLILAFATGGGPRRPSQGFRLRLEVMIRDKDIRSPGLAACPVSPDRHGGRRRRGQLLVLGAKGFHPGGAGGVPDFPAGPARQSPPAAAPGANALGDSWSCCWRRCSWAGSVWLVTVEITSLAGELPTYTENIKGKIRSLRQMGQGAVTERLEKMIEDITREWNSQPAKAKGEGADKPTGSGIRTAEKPAPGRGAAGEPGLAVAVARPA